MGKVLPKERRLGSLSKGRPQLVAGRQPFILGRDGGESVAHLGDPEPQSAQGAGGCQDKVGTRG